MLAFPFETITAAANRASVIDRVFDFFGLAGLPVPNADFNDDGIINSADYTMWRNSLGQATQPGAFGDADYNGIVDRDDYLVWRQQFGTTRDVGSASSAEVPQASLVATVAETTDRVGTSAFTRSVAIANLPTIRDGRNTIRGTASRPIATREVAPASTRDLLLLLDDPAWTSQSVDHGSREVRRHQADKDASPLWKFGSGARETSLSVKNRPVFS
jgi:hypothetical protein